jgi:hypothetical protein
MGVGKREREREREKERERESTRRPGRTVGLREDAL